jgi:hypothetical protein
MPISNALRRVYVSNPSDETYLETLEISHPAWSSAYAFVAAPTAFTGGTSHGNVDYVPLPFSVTLPESSGEGVVSLQVTIVNAGLEMMNALELAAKQPGTPIRVTFRIYVDSDLTTPASDEIVMDASAVADDTTVSLNALPADMLNVQWPRVRYRAPLFPGLDR